MIKQQHVVCTISVDIKVNVQSSWFNRLYKIDYMQLKYNNFNNSNDNNNNNNIIYNNINKYNSILLLSCRVSPGRQ